VLINALGDSAASAGTGGSALGLVLIILLLMERI
jgi:hypothetical protein